MRIQRILAWIWTALLLVACFLPARWMPVAERKIDSQARRFGIPVDKVVHFTMFAGFAFLWSRGERPSRRIAVLAAGVGAAVITEVVQNHPIIARDGEVLDAVADLFGVLSGTLAAAFLSPRQVIPADDPI